MSQSIRVIGRVDLAQEVRDALAAEGLDAEIVTAGPMSVFTAAPPPGGVDVVVATSLFDPLLWWGFKARHPARPMVAVAPRIRERFLDGLVLRRNGPDAGVPWPASSQELAVAVERARATAARPRRWGRLDLATAAAWLGVAAAWVGARPGLPRAPGTALEIAGSLIAAIGLLVLAPFAWPRRWVFAGGALYLALAGGRLFLLVLYGR